MARPIIAWSYSTLNTFENCPRKFWAVKIKKIDDSSSDNRAGKADHRALQYALSKNLSLPGHLKPMQPVIDKIKKAPGELYVEYQMTLTQTMVPCGWKDWDNAWVRGASDVLKVNGDRATYLDWKRGKVRESDDQMELTALLVFRHFPQVQQVNGGLIHYMHGETVPHVVHRADESKLWNGYIARVKVLEDAVREDNFPATPNPLCGWCPYRACPHNTVEKRLAREAANAAR